RGKWYSPREDAGYKATGTASWYGDAFHGRLTANGEIYDMNHLSAAHPTMPLPSYARVTNVKNGKSVIVRVNDRGPYAHNRLVDLSKRAAQLLDYTNSGVAQVRMEYIGRAPVHGQDDEYLLASYSDGNSSAPNVMVAMNDAEATPVTDVSVPGVAFAPEVPQQNTAANILQANPDPLAIQDDGIGGALPVEAPVLVDRPANCLDEQSCANTDGDVSLSGYAQVKAQTDDAFASFGLSTDKSGGLNQAAAQERVLLGSYSAAEAKRLQRSLSKLAVLTYESSGESRIEVFARPVSGLKMDDLVRKLWKKGFSDAFVVR
ncbi:MAG: septal ring lytic transglycosylase RlpA family protein, partial [Rhizobiaceae bacterium]